MCVMPDLAGVLKEEIARLARRALRKELDGVKKVCAECRKETAALKRQVADLSRKLSKGAAAAAPAAVAAADGEWAARGERFTAKGLKSQRKRLGFSAADYGKLVGVSGQSIYKWERGQARPRARQVARLAALRGIGKKVALARLAAK